AVRRAPCEGIGRPFGALDADDVRMPGDEQWTLAAISTKPGQKVSLAGFRRRHDVDGKTERPEPGCEQVSDLSFASGRVAGVDSDELLEQDRRGIQIDVARRRASRDTS